MATAVEETQATAIEDKVANLIYTQPWAGVVSKEEAVCAALSYRAGLSDDDRQAYDEQIRLGIHPSRAQEAVERFSGRQPSRVERNILAPKVHAA